MDELDREAALRLLGTGMASRAGQQVNAPNRAAELAAQEAAAMAGQQPMPAAAQAQAQPSPYGGPAQPPTYMPNGIPKQNGGRMTPAQAKKLAEMLRNR
jgi:hypothetical protein